MPSAQQAMKLPIAPEALKASLNYDSETGNLYRISNRQGGFKIGALAGYKHHSGYIYIKVNGKTYAAHRLAWLFHYGEIPDGEIDHINCNKSDNRIINLRLSDRKGNVCNVGLRKDNTSGVKGVSWHRECGKWVAYVRHNGRKIYVGLFSELSDAADAVSEMRKSLHKDFARDKNEVQE